MSQNNVMMSDAGGHASKLSPLSYQMAVNSSSYGNNLYMDSKSVDQAIEIVNELGKKLYEVFSELMIVEDTLRKKGEASGWWSIASNFDPGTFYNHKFLSLADSGNVDLSKYPANKLLSVYHGEIGLANFNVAPSFNGLASSLDEIKQAIINYSNGVDVDNAITSLRAWIGSDFNLSNASLAGSFAAVGANLPEKVDDNINVDIPSLGSDIMNSEVIDFDDIDGADNITVKDSVTDDIIDVSSDDLIKDSSSIGIPGVASIIGSSTRNGSLAGATGIGAGILGLAGNAPLEALSTGVDDIGLDGTDASGSLSDVVSDFITPNARMASDKKIKSASAGVSAVAATVAGVGTLSAGAVGGKVYMNKKKKDEDDDEEDVNYDDDDFFDREDDTDTYESTGSIVDFKNEILSDDL